VWLQSLIEKAINHFDLCTRNFAMPLILTITPKSITMIIVPLLPEHSFWSIAKKEKTINQGDL
jgi:hypothetical protein